MAWQRSQNAGISSPKRKMSAHVVWSSMLVRHYAKPVKRRWPVSEDAHDSNNPPEWFEDQVGAYAQWMNQIRQHVADEKPAFNPYYHELNTNGTACATECPACRYSQDKALDKLRETHLSDGTEKDIQELERLYNLSSGGAL
jgi:hypothetical protein